MFSKPLIITTAIFLLMCFAIAPLVAGLSNPSVGFLYPANYVIFILLSMYLIGRDVAPEYENYRLIFIVRVVLVLLSLGIGLVIAVNSAFMFGLEL